MKKTLLISGVLLALAASTAMAGGVNLSWTDCGTNGATNRTFTCANNSGTNTLVTSFQPHIDIADAVGWDVRIDLQSADATNLNAWWQMFNSGSCRGTAVPVTNVSFGGSCVDFFGGAGAGGIAAYTITGNTAKLALVWAVPDPAAIFAADEIYAINVVINNSRTVGTPSCAGCQTGVCLVANVVAVAYGPNATLQHPVENPLDNNFATWQGGTGVIGGCPGATPTTTKSWGSVKALYR